MKQRIDKKLKKIIIKAIKTQFFVNDSKELISVDDNLINSPKNLSDFIIEVFDIQNDLADLITYNWLFKNGYENILTNWEIIPYLLDGYIVDITSSASTTSSDLFISTDVIRPNVNWGGNQFTYSRTPIPEVDNFSFSASSNVNYIIGCDTAVSQSYSTVTIQQVNGTNILEYT